jgi:hypothetical protein
MLKGVNGWKHCVPEPPLLLLVTLSVYILQTGIKIQTIKTHTIQAIQRLWEAKNDQIGKKYIQRLVLKWFKRRGRKAPVPKPKYNSIDVYRGLEGKPPWILDPGSNGDEWLISCIYYFMSGERIYGINWIGGWMGLRLVREQWWRK